ncbi:hypothetical protein PAXRUDRAFT_161873, partial [Paxillus rubicundulus Ve08.2h10]
DFTMTIGDGPPDHIVCVDESAVNALTTYFMNRWSCDGLCAQRCSNFFVEPGMSQI